MPDKIIRRHWSDEDVRELIREELKGPVSMERMRDIVRAEMRDMRPVAVVLPPRRWFTFFRSKKNVL